MLSSRGALRFLWLPLALRWRVVMRTERGPALLPVPVAPLGEGRAWLAPGTAAAIRPLAWADVSRGVRDSQVGSRLAIVSVWQTKERERLPVPG